MHARPSLATDRYTPDTATRQAAFHADIVREVAEAVARDTVVVVGMKTNPHVKSVRAALKDAGIAFTYLEYGGYLSMWKQRLAIKMWSGWPTFPQVFISGVLVGGGDDCAERVRSGELAKWIAEGPPRA